jgi:formate dehydrogenase
MQTYCRICEAACGLSAELNADGRLVALRPDRAHPTSRGYACAKGTRFAEVADHPQRLLAPRIEGAAVDWAYANRFVGDRVRRIIDTYGPHAVGVYYGNPLAFNALGFAATLAFAKALGTRNVYYAGSQDCANKFAGADIVHGSPVIQAVPDFGRTDLAVVFGSNPYVSQSSFIHLEGGGPANFGAIVRRGGRVVWVDPRRSESAEKWGEHLAVTPGSDVWLLAALLRLCMKGAPVRGPARGLAELRDAVATIDLDEVSVRTGIPRRRIEALARDISQARSVALHMSVGVNMGGFGTLAYVLLQALAYVTGNYDRVGGLLVHPLSPAVDWVFRKAGILNEHRSRVGDFASVLGAMPGAILADEILTEGPEKIRALIVLAGDPLRSIPGSDRLAQALGSLELLACVDMFDNATGHHAHALLPSASWLERWDVAISTMTFQRAPLLQATRPVMAPPGDVRTDARIIADLALAAGLRGGPWWRLARARLDRWLPAPGYGFPVPTPRPGRWLRRHTLRLWDARVAAEFDRLRAHPAADPAGFSLIGRRRRLGHNSWLHGGRRDGPSESVAWMRPEDLQGLGLHDGDTVEIRAGGQTLQIPVQGHASVAARTIVVPHGLPGININALIPGGADRVERISGQLTMTGIAAQVAAVG